MEGGIGATLMDMEENYEVSRWNSFRKFVGTKSVRDLQSRLYEPCPAFDEHSGLTLREVQGSRVSDLLIKVLKGEMGVDGWRPVF